MLSTATRTNGWYGHAGGSDESVVLGGGRSAGTMWAPFDPGACLGRCSLGPAEARELVVDP